MVEPVGQLLTFFEQGLYQLQHQRGKAADDGQHREDIHGQTRVHDQRHHRAADQQHRSGQHHAHHHEDEILQLLYVVGAAGDQRGSADLVDIALGQAFHLQEHLLPQDPAVLRGKPRGTVGIAHGKRHAQQGADEHQQPHLPDVIHILIADAVVDDQRHQRRQQQRHPLADEHQENGQRHVFSDRFQKFEYPDQYGSSRDTYIFILFYHLYMNKV